MLVSKDYLFSSFGKIGKIVDGFLHSQTYRFEGVKIQSQVIPIREYFSYFQDLQKSIINYESVVCLKKKAQDISPGVFKNNFLDSNLTPLFNIEVLSNKLDFLGNLSNLEVDYKSQKISKIFTNLGHEICVNDYYLDIYKNDKYLIVTSSRIDFCQKSSSRLFFIRAFYNQIGNLNV